MTAFDTLYRRRETLDNRCSTPFAFRAAGCADVMNSKHAHSGSWYYYNSHQYRSRQKLQLNSILRSIYITSLSPSEGAERDSKTPSETPPTATATKTTSSLQAISRHQQTPAKGARRLSQPRLSLYSRYNIALLCRTPAWS